MFYRKNQFKNHVASHMTPMQFLTLLTFRTHMYMCNHNTYITYKTFVYLVNLNGYRILIDNFKIMIISSSCIYLLQNEVLCLVNL